MRRPGQGLELVELQARLERLRQESAWLRGHAAFGAQLRRLLAAAGSATWKPCEDLSFRRWIERQGDEQARELLCAIDVMLEQLAAKAAAEGREAN